MRGRYDNFIDTVHLELHPFYYIPLTSPSSPLFQTIFGGFILHTHTHTHTHGCFFPLLSFLPSPLLIFPQRVPLLHSCPIIIITAVIILDLDSSYKQKHNICLLSLAYVVQHDDLKFYPFSFK
jgi:hypothetical protein